MPWPVPQTDSAAHPARTSPAGRPGWPGRIRHGRPGGPSVSPGFALANGVRSGLPRGVAWGLGWLCLAPHRPAGQAATAGQGRWPMTHAALVNAALVFFLALVTLLLVMFIGAVIAAPSASPGSSATPEGEAPAPLPRRQPPATAPARPAALPRRRPPLSAANAADTVRWSDADPATDLPVSVYNGVRRPKVSGSPPWGPAPKPPASTRGQPTTPRPDRSCGQTRGRCPRLPGGPPTARHRRARPRPQATRPDIPGTPGDADQRRRILPGSPSAARRRARGQARRAGHRDGRAGPCTRDRGRGSSSE